MDHHNGAQLLSDLSLVNPWWIRPEALDAVDAPNALVRRAPGEHIVAHLRNGQDSRAALLIGPRRVGKTTLAREVLRDLARGAPAIPMRNLVYVDFQERLFGQPSLREVIDAVLPGTDPAAPAVFVFDEIQFVTEWDKALRGAIQSHSKDRVRILATGSGTAELRRAKGDTLLGRVAPFRLGTFVFAEFLELVGVGHDRPRPQLREAFERYLRRGGFPELAATDDEALAWRRLRGICESHVLDGDVVRRLGIRRPETLGRLWLHLVRNPGQILNAARLGEETETKRDTIEEWLAALRQAELIVAVEPSDTSGRPVAGKNRYPRAYPTDHGLCAAYGLDPGEGAALETLVLRQLRAYMELRELANEPTLDLTYWRDDRGGTSVEVDFRLRSPSASMLVEVKGTSRPSSDHVGRLARVASRLASDDAILVHRGEQRETIVKQNVRIHLWPVLDFCLALSESTATLEDFRHE